MQRVDGAIGGLPVLFIDNNSTEFKTVFLPEDVYAEAIQTLVVVCVDMIIVNKNERAIYLAKRKAKPASEKYWVIGGRCMAGEKPEDSLLRVIKRETGLDLFNSNKFKFLGMYRYFFADRQQSPQTFASDSLTYTFYLELDEYTIDSIHLDENEYYSKSLRKFTSIEELVENDIGQPIIDFYNRIYS